MIATVRINADCRRDQILYLREFIVGAGRRDAGDILVINNYRHGHPGDSTAASANSSFDCLVDLVTGGRCCALIACRVRLSRQLPSDL